MSEVVERARSVAGDPDATRDELTDVYAELSRHLTPLNAAIKSARNNVERQRLAAERDEAVAVHQTLNDRIRKANKSKAAVQTVSYQVMAWAIKAHRDACLRAEIEPEPHDELLWSVLDDVGEPWMISKESDG